MNNLPDGPERVEEETAPPPPPYTTEGINVLIVGETQQGKSTLIKQLSKYAGLSDLNIAIGRGNGSCTKSVGFYSISTELQQYQLVNFTGNPLPPDLSYTQKCDLTNRTAKVVPVEDTRAEKINFTIIDTPGLSDSDSGNDDMDTMASIIGRLGELHHINAVVYVRSIQEPFGQSFKDFFNYFQRSMPSLSNGLIIVHSNFSTFKVEEFLDDEKNLAALRREAFKAATNLELSHFFMDNEPLESSPFAVCQSLNAVHRLLSQVSSQQASSVGDLNLLKTPKMTDLDAHVINVLNDLKIQLERTWNDKKSMAETLDQITLGVSRDLAKIQRKLAAKQERLQELKNGSDIILGTRNVIEDYSFLSHLLLEGQVNLGRKVVSFDSDYKITTVRKTCSGGSQWLDEERRGTSWRAIITSGWFRDIEGSATFHTTSQLRHAGEIRELELSVADLEDDIVNLNATMAKAGMGASTREVHALGEKIEGVEALAQTVRNEALDIGLWPQLRVFYASQGRPTRHEVRSFVRVYDKELAEMITG
jgi:hypothetical protein